MYINFHKYNYSIIDKDKQDEYIERDKKAYLKVLDEWFNLQRDMFVERKWEIDEIHYLKEIDSFINLVREAESLYELGFFTSCIALVGVSAEDFSKYLSLRNNRQDHITALNRQGRMRDVSQFDRLQLQLNEQMINQTVYDFLDDIRKIRNDCLHYNNDFKQKDKDQLKQDAITSLNNLKQVLKEAIGTEIDASDFKELSNELIKQMNADNFEETVWKHKNMFSHLLEFPVTQDPDIEKVTKQGLYRVLDVDDDEVTLQELESLCGANLVVYVDIDSHGRNLLDSNNLVTGDYVYAQVYSNVAFDGQTRDWYFDMLKKIENSE